LKNQDPLSPTDSTQFTNQLVQYSEVEQQININSNLQTLISLQKGSSQSTAISYIGQTVSASGNSLPLESGEADFSYTLPSNASKLSITLQDSAGNTVATLASPSTTAGTHMVSWNGTSSSGTQLADGQYTISISASDGSGNAITASTDVYGTVTGVTADPTNGTELQLGAVNVPLANVTSILPANALASLNSSSSSNTSN
jgi:flagellar basal-body rod modification protein FlgD